MSTLLVFVLFMITAPLGTFGLFWSSTPDPVIRLYGGNKTAGVVQVKVNDKWNTICDDMWDANDASVVCRELGLEGNEHISGSPDFFNIPLYRTDEELNKLDIIFINVECTGTESSLLDCLHGEYTSLCHHDEDAGVICTEPIVLTTDAMTTDMVTTETPETTQPLVVTETPDFDTTPHVKLEETGDESEAETGNEAGAETGEAAGAETGGETVKVDHKEARVISTDPSVVSERPLVNTVRPDVAQIQPATSDVNTKSDDVIGSRTPIKPQRPRVNTDPSELKHPAESSPVISSGGWRHLANAVSITVAASFLTFWCL